MDLKTVNFEVPDIERLKKRGFTCVDSHCHTHFSDGADLNNVLRQCKSKGIGVAITDHNEVKGAIKASKQKDVPIIPGMEINTNEGPHFLAYFYDIKELEEFHAKHIEPVKFFNRKKFTHMADISLLELTDILKKYNCVTCLPHPYAPSWANINRAIIKNPENKRVIQEVDAIEVISAVQTNSWNNKAHALQILFDKSVTGGSDAHRIKDIGNSVTIANAESVNGFLDALKNKKTMAVGLPLIGQKASVCFGAIKRHGSRAKVLIRNRFLSRNDPIP